MKKLQSIFWPFACLLMLAACGPSTDIPGVNNQIQGGGTTTTGTTTNSGSGVITLGSSSTGGNANNTSSTTPSTDVGTVSVTGAINGNTFTAKDAVFGLSQTSGGLVVMQVIIADQPNLCQFLAAQTGSANLVLAYLASTNPNTYPAANTYPVADPNGTLPDSVANYSAFSQVGFAANGASVATFANNGQVQITSTAANTTQGESMTIQATDAAQDSVQGTLTPAYCNVISSASGTSTLALPWPRLRSLQ